MRFARLVGLTILMAGLTAAAPADGPRAPPTPQGRLEDIAAFRQLFMAKDMSYAPAARAEAERRLTVLESQAATVSEPYFELELARIVALADNGHTHYVLSSISRYYDRVPVRLAVFGEDFYVVRAIEAQADLLGARLVAIDGHPIEVLRKAGRELWGGANAWRDRFCFELLESPDLLHTLNLAADGAAATYRFQTSGGKMIERRLEGDPPGPERPFSNPAQTLFPQWIPAERGLWRTALPVERAPLSLRDWPIKFRQRAAPEIQAAVMDMRQNLDANGFKIGEAIQSFQALVAREKPVNLVIDMRVNDGGDLRTTRAFMQSLSTLVPGRIFVLTSPLTFSAAIASVAYAKQAAPGRITIVGEGVGDRLMFFAEGRGADLPNNRAMIGMGTQRHDYMGGCKAFKDCQSAVTLNPIAVASLAPDIAAPWTIEAYLAGRDPAMEAVAAALRRDASAKP